VAESKKLTPQQYIFLQALQRAITMWNHPVSVRQIRVQLKKSDSRVRSHIKVLSEKGYVCCVGKARVKRYVPSVLWFEELDDKSKEIERLKPWAGGYCMTSGCNQKAEDYWRDGYYCRDCIIGHDSVSDTKDLREQFLLRASAVSSAQYMLEGVLPDDASRERKNRSGSVK